MKKATNMFEDLAKIAIALSCLGLMVPFKVLVGYIAGWLVSLFFDETILHVLAAFGIYGITLPQLGATMAFLSSWLVTTVNMKK